MGVTEHGLKVGARAGLCSVVAALLLGVFAVASVAVLAASATGSKVSAFTTRVEVSDALLIGGDHQPALAPSVLASSRPSLEYDAPVGSLVDASTPVLSEGAFPQVIVDTGGSPGVGAESVGTRTTSARSLVTPSGPLSRADRLDEVFNRLRQGPRPENADDALGLLSRTLDEVEDAHSGVPRNPNPGLAPDGRMYPPQADNIIRHTDGSITATSRRHTIEIDPGGRTVIRDRASGQ
ncbi:MAG: hypothetical protein KDB26_11135 [Microthrixaceae bacterium]|nr:hypothetical protein [Microthrixaceae bacterium]